MERFVDRGATCKRKRRMRVNICRVTVLVRVRVRVMVPGDVLIIVSL